MQKVDVEELEKLIQRLEVVRGRITKDADALKDEAHLLDQVIENLEEAEIFLRTAKVNLKDFIDFRI